MANEEQVRLLKKGVCDWNEWRSKYTEVRPSLYEATLIGAELNEADFRGASLELADLSGAKLRGARLREARLGQADLSEADLTGADLTGADLHMANLSEANLANADLTDAIIYGTIFADNDLSETKGLNSVRHRGPSTIGIDTIYRSNGRIPLAFLRGAGVPEIFIEYMPSLVAPGAIQFYSCFISYSSKDQEFAERLYADLQNKGVRCWFAHHDIRGGNKIYEQIDQAIRVHERLLLILSRHSMKSEWVKTEISKARQREIKEKRRVLFPIRLVSIGAVRAWECFDALIGKDSAIEVLEYHIPDFSDWKNHDSYAEGLKNLLRDLKTEQPKTA